FDFSNGVVLLSITAGAYGGCPETSDQVQVNIDPAIPASFLGDDQTACANATISIFAEGVVISSAAQWQTTGNGSLEFPDGLSGDYAFAEYTPANGEAGSTITFTVTSAAQGS